MTQLVCQELVPIAEESLDDILRTSHHNDHSGVCSVKKNIMEQVMLYLLREDVAEEITDAHIAKFFYINAASQRLSKKLVTSSSFIVPIASVVRHKPTLSLPIKMQ